MMYCAAPKLTSSQHFLIHQAFHEYGISMYTQDCIIKFHLPRANYQRWCQAHENGKIIPASPLVKKMVQLFQQFSLLPEIWTTTQMYDALADGLPIIDELHARFLKIRSSILVMNQNSEKKEKLKDFLLPHFEHCLDQMSCSLPEGPKESLFSRFFFGQASSLLIMNGNSSYNQVQNNFHMLEEHISEVFNSPECINAKLLTSKIWLDWFIRKPGPLNSDKRSFERMGIAMAILGARSYDIVLTGCDGGNNLVGLLAWAHKNLSIFLHIILFASNHESCIRYELLFKFLSEKHRISNLKLDIITGNFDHPATWLEVAQISRAGHRVFMGVEINRNLSFGDPISEGADRKSHLAFAALYLKSSDLPSLAFWPNLLCDNLKHRAERINEIWTRYNFQPLTAILEESMSVKCVSTTFVFGNRVASSHRDFISRILPPALPQAPFYSEDNQNDCDVVPSISASIEDKMVGWFNFKYPKDRRANTSNLSAVDA